MLSCVLSRRSARDSDKRPGNVRIRKKRGQSPDAGVSEKPDKDRFDLIITRVPGRDASVEQISGLTKELPPCTPPRRLGRREVRRRTVHKPHSMLFCDFANQFDRLARKRSGAVIKCGHSGDRLRSPSSDCIEQHHRVAPARNGKEQPRVFGDGRNSLANDLCWRCHFRRRRTVC